MAEILPVLMGFALGIAIWCYTDGRVRLIVSFSAVAIVGLAATLFSGEFQESWSFLFLDLCEATVGVAIGFLVSYFLFRPSDVHTRRSSATI